MPKPTKQSENLKTFINPAGFIEQYYVGRQTAKTVSEGIKRLQKCIDQVEKSKQTIFILVDLTQMTETDLGAHKTAILAMRKLHFKRGALYGPLSIQVLLNTLALVADKQQKVKAFGDRFEAIKWLRVTEKNG